MAAKRPIQIHIMAGESTIRILEEVQDKTGLSKSEIIRRAIENKVIHSQSDYQTVYHLARIGNNLNQLTRYTHEVGVITDYTDLKNIINEIKLTIEDLRRVE